MLQLELLKQEFLVFLILCSTAFVIKLVGLYEDVEVLYLALSYRNNRKNQHDDESS